MPTKSRRVRVPGSDRKPVVGAQVVGPAASEERLEVTVRVRPRVTLPSLERLGTRLPLERRHLTREEHEARHGADRRDLKQVERFAREHRLVVVDSSVAGRSVVLSGTIAAFSEAFGVKLEMYEHPDGVYRGRTGPLHIPAELKDVVRGVFGLDNRRFARPHLSRVHQAASRSASSRSFTPPRLAKLYDFPTGLNGEGQCIGILELGGGYRPADLASYFGRLGLPVPRVTSVSVDHAHNHPVGSPESADAEVVMDIQVAGAIAPKAHIVVYFAPNASNRNFLDALNTAVHDKVHRPSVISISWGGPEAATTVSFMREFDEALQSAAAMGITVCCSAGDDGAADMRSGAWDRRAHVDFPASSPFALACGGTRLAVSSGRIARETVWNQRKVDPKSKSFGSTGGGISEFFRVPRWQKGSSLPKSVNRGARAGRGVPDVAGVADPKTGYEILVDGKLMRGVGGTSAVAPLWAGLIALINQSLGCSVGYLTPLLYGRARLAGVFRDIVSGDNKVGGPRVGYAAGPGWDACTGLGSPDGQKLLVALRD